MTKEEFVEAIRSEVLRPATDLSQLEQPAGRRPARRLVELSTWYRGLSERDRAMVQRVARYAAHGATFGFLAVLDGVRVIAPGAQLRLLSVQDGEEHLLNSDEGEMLHDLLNSELPEGDQSAR